MSEPSASKGGTSEIRRVAVLGAGTMGAAIAAHAVNAGLDVDLLDIAPTELTEQERERGLALDHPEVHNRIVRAGFERMTKARPAALATPELAARIRLGNFEDDFDRVGAAAPVVLDLDEERVGLRADPDADRIGAGVLARVLLASGAFAVDADSRVLLLNMYPAADSRIMSKAVATANRAFAE